jgi:hypothetical protein
MSTSTPVLQFKNLLDSQGSTTSFTGYILLLISDDDIISIIMSVVSNNEYFRSTLAGLLFQLSGVGTDTPEKITEFKNDIKNTNDKESMFDTYYITYYTPTITRSSLEPYKSEQIEGALLKLTNTQLYTLELIKWGWETRRGFSFR